MFSHTLVTALLLFNVWRDACDKIDKSLCPIGRTDAVKPVLDLANNMRMVLVPGMSVILRFVGYKNF